MLGVERAAAADLLRTLNAHAVRSLKEIWTTRQRPLKTTVTAVSKTTASLWAAPSRGGNTKPAIPEDLSPPLCLKQWGHRAHPGMAHTHGSARRLHGSTIKKRSCQVTAGCSCTCATQPQRRRRHWARPLGSLPRRVEGGTPSPCPIPLAQMH
jgi:hypothetical protein